mgnify:CR=1 FL=1
MADTKLAERLADIIGMLNNGESINPAILAEKYRTSERTIQRDLTERLSFLSIIKSDSGWKMDAHSIGKLSQKVIKNFAAISGIRELFPTLDNHFLKSIMKIDQNSAFLIKPHGYEHLSDQFSKQLFTKLEQIITKNECIHFYYKAKDYKHIKPYKLINARGIWYLAAVDKGKLKTFHFSEISSVWPTNECFERDPSIETQILEEESIWFSDEKYEVLLKIDAKVASYFTRRKLIPEQELTKKCDDGSLILTAKIADTKQILPIIKYWIPHITIISPSSLNVELRESINSYLNE